MAVFNSSQPVVNVQVPVPVPVQQPQPTQQPQPKPKQPSKPKQPTQTSLLIPWAVDESDNSNPTSPE